jgi:hypothetical protein
MIPVLFAGLTVAYFGSELFIKMSCNMETLKWSVLVVKS